MIAVLGYASLIEYEDLVRVLDGAQSMGDHDTRPAFGDTFCGLLDQLLAHTVHTAGGLVKNKDTRVVHTGTDEGDELPLPHTKNAPSFAHLGIIPLWQPDDELVCTHLLGSSHHSLP